MPPRAVDSKRGEHTYMPTSTDSEVSLEPPEETGAYFEWLIDTLLIEFDDADIEPICVANRERPHLSLKYKTPDAMHRALG